MEENAQVKVSAIIVAAGASRRMGFDKLSYRLPGGKTVLETSVAAFAAHPQVDELILVAGGNPACLPGDCSGLPQAVHRGRRRRDPRRQCVQRSARGKRAADGDP